ncbi:hypothetical protein ACFXTH_032896 [Malus domestica]
MEARPSTATEYGASDFELDRHGREVESTGKLLRWAAIESWKCGHRGYLRGFGGVRAPVGEKGKDFGDFAQSKLVSTPRILTWLRFVLEVLLICDDFRSFLLFRFGVVEIKANAFDRETTCCLEQVIAENGIVDCIPRLLAARKRIRHTERRSVFGSERVDLAAVARREENYA